MIEFIKKIILLSATVFALLMLISLYPGLRYHFKNGEVNSNLFILPQNTNFDLMILGNSHGRLFSWQNNHETTEKILGKSIVNLATGSAGVYPESLYFDYFFSRGNSTKTVLYFVDPWVFYSPAFNDKLDLNEPFDLNFLSFILKKGVDPHVLLNYFYFKTTWYWIAQSPIRNIGVSAELSSVDETIAKKRIENLYPDGTSSENFQKYIKYLYSIAQSAKEKGVRLILVIPSTLLGDMPGESELKTELAKIHDQFGTEFYDLSNAITDPHLYADTDHLNTKGVIEFSEKYLRPILEKK